MTTSLEGSPVPSWDMADRLRKTLRESDIGVQEMADYLGVSRNTVSAWINGRTPFNPECLGKWATLTGFSERWIEHGDNAGPTPPRPPGMSLRRHPKARVVQLHAVTDGHNANIDDDAMAFVRLSEELPRVDSNHQPSG